MGKVHGSLARAGKVKSATPKVGYSFFLWFSVVICERNEMRNVAWNVATDGARGGIGFCLDDKRRIRGISLAIY